ncbi:hypothetical protein Y10_22290 [Neptunitalea sp. Y10]|uniref:Uncharacterized protein n=1 Tax=Neptunitalea lumnitzerae TaxID=2965509 RepID=A0ABQ5MKC8_9FLAO|nr:hypothetical protein Y10_22290 [Neptunitalea sp. Y10]
MLTDGVSFPIIENTITKTVTIKTGSSVKRKPINMGIGFLLNKLKIVVNFTVLGFVFIGYSCLDSS